MPRRAFDFGSFMVWTSVFGVVFFIGNLRAPAGSIVLVNYAFFLLIAYAGIIGHEIAHALVARAVGLRAGVLCAGAGPLVIDRLIGGVLVQIGAFPGGGATFLGARSARWLRLRLLPTYAAGILFNGATALIVAAFVDDWSDLLVPRFGERFEPWSALFLISVVHVLFALIPMRTKGWITGARGRTDGLQLLYLAFLTEGNRRALIDENDRYEGMLLLHAGRNAEARDAALTMLARNPENPSAKLQLSGASLGLGDYAAARDLCLELIAHQELGAIWPILANNLAWTNLMLGRPDLLVEADELSEQAVRRAPKAAYALGTRGSVLAQLGQFDEATRLLGLAFKRNDTAKNRAYNACFLAMIAARRGDAGSALRWIGTAERLHPACDMLERARGAVVAPRTSGPLFALA